MIIRVAFHDSSPEPITADRPAQFRAWMKEMPGFVAGWHGTDPETGRVVTFTVWESEEHMKALHDKVPPGGPVGMKPVQQELFPVAIPF